MKTLDIVILLFLSGWAGLMTVLGPAATIPAILGVVIYCVALICEAIKQR